MSVESRRRSSQHPKRISLLPSDICDENYKRKTFNVSKLELQKAASCILSSVLTINSEFSDSDGTMPFSENIPLMVDQIFDNLGCSNFKVKGHAESESHNDSSSESSSMIDKAIPLKIEAMEYRTQRIKDLSDEKSKWIRLLQKVEDNAIWPGPTQQPNKVIEKKDVPENVKNRAMKSQYFNGEFPYQELTLKCQKMSDRTLFEMENCVAKANQLKKIHSKFQHLVDEQFDKFMLNIQDTSILYTSDSDIRQVIEKRIALVSPPNNNDRCDRC